MEMTAYEHGIPNWVDIGEPDPAGAADFYRSLFGWESEEGPAEYGGYRLCQLRDHTVAGIGPQMNQDMPPFWTSYVNVDDAAAIAARVPELGGQVIVPPMEVGPQGTMAVFCDPTGAFFSVWQGNEFPGAELVNEAGTFGWSELVTTDTAAAIAFYTELFGWTAATQDPPGPMPYTEWQVGGRSIAGMMAKPEMMPAEVPSHWAVYFVVDDADASAAKVAELGGTVIMPPMDIPVGRFAVVADPYGASFYVIRLTTDMTG